MIIFQAKLTGVKRMKTRLKISFSTADAIDELVLLQLRNTEGWLAFNEDKFKEQVEKAMEARSIAVSTKGKSKSQTLRGILWSVWNTLDEDITFEKYYEREMSKINSHYYNKYLKK